MAKIISSHSFRGGTGKSNMAANIATLLAAEGQRIGVVDTDIQSPGIHVLFRISQENMSRSLNDYLWARYGTSLSPRLLRCQDGPAPPRSRPIYVTW